MRHTRKNRAQTTDDLIVKLVALNCCFVDLLLVDVLLVNLLLVVFLLFAFEL